MSPPLPGAGHPPAAILVTASTYPDAARDGLQLAFRPLFCVARRSRHPEIQNDADPDPSWRRRHVANGVTELNPSGSKSPRNSPPISGRRISLSARRPVAPPASEPCIAGPVGAPFLDADGPPATVMSDFVDGDKCRRSLPDAGTGPLFQQGLPSRAATAGSPAGPTPATALHGRLSEHEPHQWRAGDQGNIQPFRRIGLRPPARLRRPGIRLRHRLMRLAACVEETPVRSLS